MFFRTLLTPGSAQHVRINGTLRTLYVAMLMRTQADPKIAKRTHLPIKEPDDVLGGEDAWKNVDKTPSESGCLGSLLHSHPQVRRMLLRHHFAV